MGDVAGLEVLGLTSDNTLVATAAGLEPGNYTIVVRKGDSALGTLLDSNGDGISLQELGEGGVVLGPDNQGLVLNAVEDALNDGILNLQLGTIVKNILEPVLDLTTTLGVGELVGILSNALNALGLSAQLDNVLDAVAEALLSNTLSLLQSTDVTATLTELSFDATATTGNVIDPAGDGPGTGEAGEDTVLPGTVVTQVENSTGDVELLVDGSATIAGLYGELVIQSNGDYSYTAYGDRNSVAQSEEFTYTISDGTHSDTATLTIEISGERLADDTAMAGIKYAYVVEDVAEENLPTEVKFSWSLGLIPGVVLGDTEKSGGNFEVAQNTTQDMLLNLNMSSIVGLAGNATLTIETGGDGNWTDYAVYDGGALLSLLGSGGAGKILVPDMPAGEYQFHLEVDPGVLSLGGSASVSVESATITHLDQYLTDKVLAVEGNLFENDVFDVVNNLETLWISTDSGANFTEVSASTTVQGEHGALVVESDGSYTYTPNVASTHLTAPVDDLFTYQVEFVDGTTEQADLTVTVTPSGAGMPDTEMNSAGFDFSNLETFAMDDGQDDEPLTLTLEDVLGTDDGEEFVTLPEPEEEQTFIAANTEDPAFDLAALDVQPVVDPLDDQWDQNSSFI